MKKKSEEEVLILVVGAVIVFFMFSQSHVGSTSPPITSTSSIFSTSTSSTTTFTLTTYSCTSSTPESFVTPSSGGPGTGFTLYGCGFPASTTQYFKVVNPNGVVTSYTFPVNIFSNGSFAQVTLPYSTSAKGTYSVVWQNSIAPVTQYVET